MYESTYGFLGSSTIIKHLFVLKLLTTVLTMELSVYIAMYDGYF